MAYVFQNSINDLKSLTAQLHIVFPTVFNTRFKKAFKKGAIEAFLQRAAFSMRRCNCFIFIFQEDVYD